MKRGIYCFIIIIFAIFMIGVFFIKRQKVSLISKVDNSSNHMHIKVPSKTKNEPIFKPEGPSKEMILISQKNKKNIVSTKNDLSEDAERVLPGVTGKRFATNLSIDETRYAEHVFLKQAFQWSCVKKFSGEAELFVDFGSKKSDLFPRSLKVKIEAVVKSDNSRLDFPYSYSVKISDVANEWVYVTDGSPSGSKFTSQNKEKYKQISKLLTRDLFALVWGPHMTLVMPTGRTFPGDEDKKEEFFYYIQPWSNINSSIKDSYVFRDSYGRLNSPVIEFVDSRLVKVEKNFGKQSISMSYGSYKKYPDLSFPEQMSFNTSRKGFPSYTLNFKDLDILLKKN